MNTRDELHAIIDRVPDDELPALAASLRAFTLVPWPTPSRPKSLGLGRSGHRDTSARADDILRETGFGE